MLIYRVSSSGYQTQIVNGVRARTFGESDLKSRLTDCSHGVRAEAQLHLRGKMWVASKGCNLIR